MELGKRSCSALIIALGFLAGVKAAVAKPLSYVGGTMAMIENDETGNTLSLDYTFSPRFAAALYAKREIGMDHEYTAVGPQLNALVKRWNAADGQGNIFWMGGTGAAVRSGSDRFAAWTSVLADYETRRVFGSYEARVMYVQGLEKSFWQRARVGVAPYLANYDDLNTWFMIQVDHHPEKRHATTVTPLVRLFYKTVLIEAGISTRGTPMFNLVKQF